MSFNSFDFLYFLLIVYAFYLVLHRRAQNLFLLVASYFFYAYWDWRFLSLVIASTLTDYFCGLAIDRAELEGKRRFFLFISIVVNLGILGFFKYFGFFLDSFQRVTV